MARIDAALDAQRDPQLDVMLTILFSGYEGEPPGKPVMGHDWGYTESTREGFRATVHHKKMACPCTTWEPRLEVFRDDPEAASPYRGEPFPTLTAHGAWAADCSKAYLAGLGGGRMFPTYAKGLDEYWLMGRDDAQHIDWQS